MVFGDRLKLLRESKDWTQQDLADKLKISRSTVAGYETKGKIPRDEILVNIANLFDTTTDWLLGRADDPRIPIDVTHEGIEAIRSWDIEKLIKFMEDLDELRHDGKPLSEEKKEAIVNFFKQIYLPGIIENETKNNGKEKN